MVISCAHNWRDNLGSFQDIQRKLVMVILCILPELTDNLGSLEWGYCVGEAWKGNLGSFEQGTHYKKIGMV